MKPILLLLLLLAGSTPLALQAQTPPPAPVAQPASPAALDSWLGPIALYPDPLLAQVLDAATQPSDVVLADHYLANGGDPNQIDAQPWSLSVKALTHYPAVLQMMEDYLPWTQALGEAYQYHEREVMDEIQRLRMLAWELGNLESTPEENVIDEDGTLEILPTDSNVIYIPQYEPEVVYAQRVGPPCLSFGPPCPLGFWMDRDFDWHHHQCLVWDHRHQRPADWWSSRTPSVPATTPPAQHSHTSALADNPRTHPTHFVLWQMPQVRVVGRSAPVGRGAQHGELRPHQIEHLASAKPSSSSLVVLPNRGAVPASHSAKGASAIQVFSSGKPVHTEEVSGGHPSSVTVVGSAGAHGPQHLSQQGHASHEVASPSHETSSHVAPTHPTSSESHTTTSSAHVQTSGHSSSGPGRH
jgi:hypothetical protein